MRFLTHTVAKYNKKDNKDNKKDNKDNKRITKITKITNLTKRITKITKMMTKITKKITKITKRIRIRDTTRVYLRHATFSRSNPYKSLEKSRPETMAEESKYDNRVNVPYRSNDSREILRDGDEWSMTLSLLSSYCYLLNLLSSVTIMY